MRIAIVILFAMAFCFSCSRDEVDGFDQEVQYAMDYDINAAGDTVYMICMPNAFTPNSDGLDDLYLVRCGGVADFDMKIFSREGNLIFESDNHHMGFDGAADGAADLSPNGVLKVKIDLTDTLSNEHHYDYDILMFR